MPGGGRAPPGEVDLLVTEAVAELARLEDEGGAPLADALASAADAPFASGGGW